jgi:hypothetical protein
LVLRPPHLGSGNHFHCLAYFLSPLDTADATTKNLSASHYPSIKNPKI